MGNSLASLVKLLVVHCQEVYLPMNSLSIVFFIEFRHFFFAPAFFFFQNFPFSNICASMIWRWFTPHHIHRSFLINVGRILKFCWHILIALKLHLRSKCYVCNTYSYRYMTLKRTITFWKWPLGTHKLPIELDRCCLLMIVERRQTPS